MCTENGKNLTRPDEPVKGVTICPECGSEDVSIISQTENGEIVCAADFCQVCHHQWNVG